MNSDEMVAFKLPLYSFPAVYPWSELEQFTPPYGFLAYICQKASNFTLWVILCLL